MLIGDPVLLAVNGEAIERALVHALRLVVVDMRTLPGVVAVDRDHLKVLQADTVTIVIDRRHGHRLVEDVRVLGHVVIINHEHLLIKNTYGRCVRCSILFYWLGLFKARYTCYTFVSFVP